MLIDASLPDKLTRYRALLKDPKKNMIELRDLSQELIEIMETELICEGLLYANS